jgi:NADP-dependent 3-hydroxy acid dehydrogenase YdfG
LVRQLADGGCRVAAVARRGDRLQALAKEYPNRIIPIVADVSKFDETPAIFLRCTDALGGLDLVIYNSGIMPDVAPTEFNFAKDHAMIETNFSGAVAWLNQAAERFLSSRRGTIVVIGSVAGDRGRRGQPVYNASKAGLHAYAEALRNRLSRSGVTVTTMKPGPVATDLVAHLGFRGAIPADQAARIIIAKSSRGSEQYLKFSHRVIFSIIRLLPSWIFRWIPI